MIIRTETHKQTVKTDVYFCKCDICGEEYQSKEGDVLCSSKCRRKAAVKRSTELRKQRRHKAKANIPAVICAHCSKPFRPLRNDAKYCSITCKQAGYRDRKNKSIIKETDNSQDPRLMRIRKIIAAIKRKPNPYRAYKLVSELHELKKKRYPLSSRAIEILTREHAESPYKETLEARIAEMRNFTNRFFKQQIDYAIEKIGREIEYLREYFMSDENTLSGVDRQIRSRLIKNILVFIGKDGLDLVYYSEGQDRRVSDICVKAPMSGYMIK